MWEGQPGFAPGYEENYDLSKRYDLFPYISVYSGGIKNPEQALSIIKKSESLEKVGPYLSKWERWYDFGLKSRLYPHSETKNLITSNSEHLNMLSEEEDKIFYEQEKLYFEIDAAVYSAMKDYLDHWVDKPFDQSYFNDDWEYKQSIFPEWLPDWNIRETSGKIGTGWLQSSYDVLSHNSETDTRNNREYAIGFHTDNKASMESMPGPKPILTATIYLNDDYEGGEVSFLADKSSSIITYKPKSGDITVFPSYNPFFHAALPVSGSKKYLIRYFLCYYYSGSEDYIDGLEEYGEEVWKKMQQYRILAEDNSGMHERHVLFPGDSPEETFRNWAKIYRKQSSVNRQPFFAETVKYVDGRKDFEEL